MHHKHGKTTARTAHDTQQPERHVCRRAGRLVLAREAAAEGRRLAQRDLADDLTDAALCADARLQDEAIGRIGAELDARIPNMALLQRFDNPELAGAFYFLAVGISYFLAVEAADGSDTPEVLPEEVVQEVEWCFLRPTLTSAWMEHVFGADAGDMGESSLSMPPHFHVRRARTND